MTEQEAKTKWCPFVRTIPARRAKDGSIEHDGGVPAFNRYNTDEAGVTTLPGSSVCIGSACMAWRWEKVERNLGVNHGYERAIENSRTEGFCGLAGKP